MALPGSLLMGHHYISVRALHHISEQPPEVLPEPPVVLLKKLMVLWDPHEVLLES